MSLDDDSVRAAISRRRLLEIVGVAGGAALVSPVAADGWQRSGVQAAAPATDASALYRSIGVRPFINGRGTYTVLGGNIELPEVRTAKSLANQMHANVDELTAAVGARLGELTGAEWGMVSAGCAAAMSYATAACVAGGNPDLHVRIPNLAGFAKDEVIIPGHSRNVYDAAIRAVGVRIVEAETPEDLERAIGPRTAMIYIFAGPRNESGPMGTEAICTIAGRYQVPVLVDAAAEGLSRPNIHLQRGATLVAYSGGKFLRGPQSAGILLGRKDLVQAAWVHSAPHHGFARGMKVGREEIVGMLVAIERWFARDHDAEWRDWTARVQHIADRVSAVAGVKAVVRTDPGGRSNRSPAVTVRWFSETVGLTGQDVVARLDAGEPRILINAAGGQSDADGNTGVTMVPSTMAPGDERVVADRLVEILRERQTLAVAAALVPAGADLSGRWTVQIRYAAGTAVHDVTLIQEGNRLAGTHRGDFVTRDIQGTISGARVTLQSNVTERTGDSLSYRFSGDVQESGLGGTLDLGEYLQATWSATRRGAARQG